MQGGSKQNIFDTVKNRLDLKPTEKELAHHVVPYCAAQWKFLGDALGFCSYEIDIIESNCHYIVEDCCRKLLHTWLQRNTDASWEALISALNSPAIYFDFTGKYSLSVSLSKYRHHLKSVYTNQKPLTNGDWPPTLHSHFVDLPLAKVPKEINRPKFDSLLFIHEKKDYEMVMIDSYEQIFQIQDNGHQVIVIEGNPGSGKTTLSYKICKDWAEGIVLKHISLIILFILRDPRISNARTLEDLITVGLGSRAQAKQVCNDLTTSCGKNVIILLEGWDELEYSKRSSSVFTDLISCQLLPEAINVITTRPAAYESIQQNAITQKIEILQFSEESFNKYINFSFCDRTPSYELKFKQEIKRVPSLSSLPYNPMCLAILLRVFMMSNNYTLPETLTKVYKKFLLISLRRHNMKTNNDNSVLREINTLPSNLKKMLYSLGRLAYEELHNDQLIFSCDMVSKIVFNGKSVPSEFDGMCLLEVHDTEMDIGIIKNYNFFHKSIQELLAAIYLMRLENIQQETEMKRIFGSKKFEMVWLFYAGLTKFEHLCLKNVFPNLPNITSSNSRSLEKFSCYEDFDSLFYNCEHHFYNLHLNKIISREFFITLVLCCYEAQCSDLCKQICSHFCTNNTCHVFIPHSATTHQTMIAVSYFVANSNRNCALECLAAVSNGLDLLLTHLRNPPVENGSKGRLWRLGYNFMCAREDIDSLCAFVQSQHYLHSLTLPYSEFSHDDIVILCETLKQHQTILKLDLTGCGITKEELVVLNQLVNVNTKLQYLAITDNHFSALDLVDFVKSLQNNNRLRELRVDAKHHHIFCQQIATKEYLVNNISTSKVYVTLELLIVWL